MRNLILLLKQFHSFFLFLILEIICLVIVFKNNHYQQSSAINSSQKIAGVLYNRKAKLLSFFRLSRINDSLMKENARLMQQLGTTVDPNPLHDTSFSREITIDSVKKVVHYEYMPARVLNNSVDQRVNYITLNAGSLQGIKKNMAVISDKGIVGKIANVSENYSIAASVLSERFNISAILPDGTIGKIVWDGKNPELVTLTGIPQSVKLKPLDTILTSSYSSIFPEKVMIGRIASVITPTSYKVWLSARFTNLHYVYIVKDAADPERIKLEESVHE